MFKKGFTLQELLITVAIIGVVAATVAPAIMSITPDATKTKYIKAYNTLTEQVEEIIGDPRFYWEEYHDDGRKMCTGLYCRTSPAADVYRPCASNGWSCSDNAKLGAIFSTRVNYNPDSRTQVNGTVEFVTTDGTHWSFVPRAVDDPNYPGNRRLEYDVTIDINGLNVGPNAQFSANQRRPDQFSFIIYNDGEIEATDPLGRAYLVNQVNLSATKEDLKEAIKIYEESKSTTE